MSILIAEDDQHLRDGIVDLLSLEGFTCRVADDGAKALALFRQEKPEICVFDVMMPVMDGLSLLAEVRKLDPAVPILLLSARGEEGDRVKGLEIGADDYIAKPFSARELVARIKAALRRVKAQGPAQPDAESRIHMGDIVVDQKAMRAFRGDQKIDLTNREVAILATLYARRGQAVSRDELFDLAWGRDYMPNSRALDQYVSALRKKIEIDPAAPRIIRTVHGVGYRHDVDAG
ncbi:DNA-binding response regulator [Methylovirgula ligni]|uniref:DNA-binding response OmpR family regulator n=1 Tax=Methylovirgula ligni TaxID=569860 RepID=A0A3D9YXF3_9HYPH|nr:response regulator transcription factor [Methylovirgula ligni]QAY96060.1 DNA-binding response regulator [Methylovirgula ligni]REF86263.1 DNA-binding response OmpR family regulator [Methylovirgula ligni]